MATQILSQTFQESSYVAARNEGNFFLKALHNIEYGQITVIAPDGERLEFSGSQKGPAVELILKDWRALDELVARGEIGFADAYIDELWSTPDLPALLTFGLMNDHALEQFFHGKPWYALWVRLKSFFHGNSLKGSRRNIMAHYDLGNDFYSLWLDKSMTYSCALFEGDSSRSLEDAQQAKYQRILRKIAAKPGENVLEIGCGWGGFAVAAARAGLRVTAITISEKQAEFAKQRIENEGLSSLVNIELRDYREMEGVFDHIVSIGMFEHVGENYWREYFSIIKKHLKMGGTALVQSITLDDYLFEKLHGKYGFIEQYIFPGGMLPSKSRFRTAALQEGLICKEMFGFGEDYARTLRNWLTRFDAQKEQVSELGYKKDFIRLWRFYLASCIASFTSKRTDVIQAHITHSA